MQITALFHLLALTSIVSAAPAPAPEAELDLVSRSPPTKLPSTIHGFPPKDWECKTSQKKDTNKKAQKFSSSYIKDSTEAALRLRDNGDNKAGNSKYPDWITSPESIPGLGDYEGQSNVDHFPLNHDDKTVFTGGNPTSGARVFYQHSVGSDEAKFLGVWTHGGKKDGSFIECKEV